MLNTFDPTEQAIPNANELIIEYIAACEMLGLGQRLDFRDFADGWMAGGKIATMAASRSGNQATK